MSAPSTEDFRQAILEILERAEKSGMTSVSIRSGDLHRELGGYPEGPHNMPGCCGAMRSLMQLGDKEIQAPPKGKGATLVIQYRLPR
ncbi:MAG: HNH endonuclease [Armatimonadota bacterium]|jgi:hypothetical protein|nr:hypothetical protein [Fimbriimonadaceae bacterium]